MANFSQQQKDDLLNLYKNLRQAYWYASTIQDKDLLSGAADAVYNLYTEINQGEIVSRDDAYVKAENEMKACVGALKKISDDVNNIVKHVATATNLLGILGKVLAFLT